MVMSLPFLTLLAVLEGFLRVLVILGLIVVVVWFHFRVYNNTMKPTLLEMIVLFLLMAALHISAVVLFSKLLSH